MRSAAGRVAAKIPRTDQSLGRHALRVARSRRAGCHQTEAFRARQLPRRLSRGGRRDHARHRCVGNGRARDLLGQRRPANFADGAVSRYGIGDGSLTLEDAVAGRPS
jgi:hypothetical protein